MAGQLTIDGKSWDYRNPYNYDKIARDSRGDDNYYGFEGSGEGNEDSLAFANPLYQYSYGAVRDAAAAEGIKNVDEDYEVERIIARLQGKFDDKKDDDDDDDKDVDILPEPETPPPPVTAPIDKTPTPPNDLVETNPVETPETPEQKITTPTPQQPVTEAAPYLSPSMSVNQNNPVEIDGVGNKVDNSINQVTSDMSDNRVFYGGSDFNLSANPALESAVEMITGDRKSEGIDFMNSPSNAQKLMETEGFMKGFMRDRLFTMK